MRASVCSGPESICPATLQAALEGSHFARTNATRGSGDRAILPEAVRSPMRGHFPNPLPPTARQGSLTIPHFPPHLHCEPLPIRAHDGDCFVRPRCRSSRGWPGDPASCGLWSDHSKAARAFDSAHATNRWRRNEVLTKVGGCPLENFKAFPGFALIHRMAGSRSCASRRISSVSVASR